jgi:hypothetical protein
MLDAKNTITVAQWQQVEWAIVELDEADAGRRRTLIG